LEKLLVTPIAIQIGHDGLVGGFGGGFGRGEQFLRVSLSQEAAHHMTRASVIRLAAKKNRVIISTYPLRLRGSNGWDVRMGVSGFKN
jgi:hypothetical protein